MIRDIMSCKAAGVDGVVVGVLDNNGYIDRPRLEVIREVSKGLLLTFQHKSHKNDNQYFLSSYCC